MRAITCLHRLLSALALVVTVSVAAPPTSPSGNLDLLGHLAPLRGWPRRIRYAAATTTTTGTATVGSGSDAASQVWERIVRGGGRGAPAPAVSQPARKGNGAGGGPFQVFCRTILDARRHLAAAAAARSTSIFLMFPVDTIKTRIQMEQANPLRIAGVYNGVVGSLVGQVPYGVLTFGSYEMYKRGLLARFAGARPVFLYAIAAILGDLTGSGWLCPSEVVKQQTQAGMYPTTAAAVSGIFQKKGIAGFYEGYLGGLARDVPFRVAQLTSYELTKNLYLRIKAERLQRAAAKDLASRRSSRAGSLASTTTQQMHLSSAEAALCGAVAGTFSAAVTSPLDRIKTLLMTNSAANGGSVAACAAKIWREEGIRGFAQGIVPRVVYIAPSVVIFFIVYEEVQQRLSHLSSTSPYS